MALDSDVGSTLHIVAGITYLFVIYLCTLSYVTCASDSAVV